MELVEYGFQDDVILYEESMEGLKDMLNNFLTNRQNKIFDKNGFYKTMKPLLDKNDKLRKKASAALKELEAKDRIIPKDATVVLNLMKKQISDLCDTNVRLVENYIVYFGIFEMINRNYKNLSNLTQERIDKTDIDEYEFRFLIRNNKKIMQSVKDTSSASDKVSLQLISAINEFLNHGIAKFHTLNKIVADTDVFLQIIKNPEKNEKIKSHPYIAKNYNKLVKAAKDSRIYTMKYIKSIINLNAALIKLINTFNTTEKIVGFIDKARRHKVATESLEVEIVHLLDVCVGLESDGLEKYGFLFE